MFALRVAMDPVCGSVWPKVAVLLLLAAMRPRTGEPHFHIYTDCFVSSSPPYPHLLLMLIFSRFSPDLTGGLHSRHSETKQTKKTPHT